MIWHIWQALLSWIGIATSAEMERCAGRLAEALGKLAMIESAQQGIIKKLHEAEDERDKALARLGSLVDTMEHLGGRVIAAENRGDLFHVRMCDAEARLANPTVTVSYPPDKPIMLPADSAKDAAIKEAIRESLKNTRGHAVEMHPSPARGFVTNRELNSYIKDLKNQQETSKVSYRGQEIDEKGSLSVDLKVKASEGLPEIDRPQALTTTSPVVPSP